MSVATTLTRLSSAIDDAYAALEHKLVSLPPKRNVKNLSASIDKIKSEHNKIKISKIGTNKIALDFSDCTLYPENGVLIANNYTNLFSNYYGYEFF